MRDPDAFVQSVFEKAKTELRSRLSHLEATVGKAETIAAEAAAEAARIRKAIIMLTPKEGMAEEVYRALADGPLSKDEIASALNVNGNRRQLHGTIVQMVRWGRLVKRGEKFALPRSTSSS